MPFVAHLPQSFSHGLTRAHHQVSFSTLELPRSFKTMKASVRLSVTTKFTSLEPPSMYSLYPAAMLRPIFRSSSGTFRAAKYASMFPEHVGRFILDAVTPHGRVSVLPVHVFQPD